MRCELEASEPDRDLANYQKSLILQVQQRLAKLPGRRHGLHQLSNFDAMNENQLQIQLIELVEKSLSPVECHWQREDYLVPYDCLPSKYRIETAYPNE